MAVNNTLSHETIPSAEFTITRLPSGRELIEQKLDFDFFNYAGILRSVNVWHLSQSFISEVEIRADATGNFL